MGLFKFSSEVQREGGDYQLSRDRVSLVVQGVTTIMVVTIDNWLLATVDMWVCDISCREARRLIEDNFDFDQVFEAYMALCENLGKKKPIKHKDKGDIRSALEKTASELVEDIYNLEQGDD